MKAYIIYDCYDGGCDFSLYHLSTTKTGLKKELKDCLYDFLMMGVDDLHNFKCVKIQIDKTGYEFLKAYNTLPQQSDTTTKLFIKLMNHIDDNNTDEVLFWTDGCSDEYAVLEDCGYKDFSDYDQTEYEMKMKRYINEIVNQEYAG